MVGRLRLVVVLGGLDGGKLVVLPLSLRFPMLASETGDDIGVTVTIRSDLHSSYFKALRKGIVAAGAGFRWSDGGWEGEEEEEKEEVEIEAEVEAVEEGGGRCRLA